MIEPKGIYMYIYIQKVHGSCGGVHGSGGGVVVAVVVLTIGV